MNLSADSLRNPLKPLVSARVIRGKRTVFDVLSFPYR